MTIYVKSRIFECCCSGFSKFQSSFVARSVERLIVYKKVGKLKSCFIWRGGRTALERRIAADGCSFSFEAFGEPPLRLTVEPLLVLFGGDLRFIFYFDIDLSVTTISKKY